MTPDLFFEKWGPNKEHDWEGFSRDLEQLMKATQAEQDATIATLRSDNLLLAKTVSGLRKLNIAYRLGDQKLADAALTELEALATAQ